MGGEKKVLNENPLQSNATLKIEIVSESDKVQGLTWYRKCCVLCGRESLGIVVLALALGGGHVYLFRTYTRWIVYLEAWIFLILGILFFSIVLWFTFCSCKNICHNSLQNANQTTDPKKKKKKRVVNQLRQWYIHRFGINGKYYLMKMYTFELLEHLQQLYSLNNIYLCFMPVEGSTIVCAVLVVELITNVWLTLRFDSQETRDMLLLLDILQMSFAWRFHFSTLIYLRAYI